MMKHLIFAAVASAQSLKRALPAATFTDVPRILRIQAQPDATPEPFQLKHLTRK